MAHQQVGVVVLFGVRAHRLGPWSAATGTRLVLFGLPRQHIPAVVFEPIGVLGSYSPSEEDRPGDSERDAIREFGSELR